MHLDEEQVQRLLHGELRGAAATSVRDHLGACAECRSRLSQAEREEAWVYDRLGRLDHTVPQVSAEAAIAARRRSLTLRGRLAAGIFLALAAAGVAYAAPGSPLPRVLDHLIHLVSREPGRPAKTAPSPKVAGPQSGIALPPGNRLVITFTATQPGDTAVVSLTDGPDVVVRTLAGGAAFTTDIDQLAIQHRGPPAGFEILIPRAAPFVEIQAGGRRILLKDRSHIVSQARPDSERRYLLPLSGAER